MPLLKPLTRAEIAPELRARFSPRQIAELVWRTMQCGAFNWHNELLELDLEPEVRPWTGP